MRASVHRRKWRPASSRAASAPGSLPGVPGADPSRLTEPVAGAIVSAASHRWAEYRPDPAPARAWTCRSGEAGPPKCAVPAPPRWVPQPHAFAAAVRLTTHESIDRLDAPGYLRAAGQHGDHGWDARLPGGRHDQEQGNWPRCPLAAHRRFLRHGADRRDRLRRPGGPLRAQSHHAPRSSLRVGRGLHDRPHHPPARALRHSPAGGQFHGRLGPVHAGLHRRRDFS